MTRIALVRTDFPLPDLTAAGQLLFKSLTGFTKDDKRAWNHFWKRVTGMEPGEIVQAEMVFPRSGPFHRRHMAIEQQVFDAQERFNDFEMFRDWLKIGAGWVTWVPGVKGGIVPLPKSIGYAKADEEEFRQYHDKVMLFLRGQHAAPFLWRHLDNPHEMIETILEGFDE